jgi:hypothetical protein
MTPGLATLPGMSPSGSEAKLMGLYFKSRELHFGVAVHESSRRRTRSLQSVHLPAHSRGRLLVRDEALADDVIETTCSEVTGEARMVSPGRQVL